MVTKKKETRTESESYSCPNPSCGKAFTNPLKAQNLTSKKHDAYDACPYCLTEIVFEREIPPSEQGEESRTEDVPSVEMEMKIKSRSPAPSIPKVEGCAHHFGFLGDREKKDKIPDECITCEKIVQCMLKNISP